MFQARGGDGGRWEGGREEGGGRLVRGEETFSPCEKASGEPFCISRDNPEKFRTADANQTPKWAKAGENCLI